MSTMEVTREIRAICAKARNLEYTRAKAAGEPRNEDAEMLRGLEAVFAHLAAREADAVPEGWIVVKEHAWDHGDGGRPTLSYLWPSEFDRKVFGSFEQASAFIRENEFPLGFVALKLAAAPVAQEAAAPVRVRCESCSSPKVYIGSNIWKCIDCSKIPSISIGKTYCFGDDDWYREIFIGEVSILAALDKQHSVISTLRRLVDEAAAPTEASDTPNLSDRYRAVMEAQGGVTDEMIERALKILHGSRHPHPKDGQAWCDAREVLEMGAALAAHLHTGHSAVPEAVKVGGPDQNYVEQAYNSGWNACRRAMLAAAPEVPK